MSNSSSSAKPPQKNSQSHDDTSSGKNPAKDKAFPLWTAISFIYSFIIYSFIHLFKIETIIIFLLRLHDKQNAVRFENGQQDR